MPSEPSNTILDHRLSRANLDEYKITYLVCIGVSSFLILLTNSLHIQHTEVPYRLQASRVTNLDWTANWYLQRSYSP